ncbi:YeeE/YedE family protein [Acidithiobacillus concretivorus]|uniref:YeeE/YedE family protein n=1 Tax=Acidithiobacillus concretivorus TaxID=3063952 RepID=A0ABS5ZL68_9PROT|nr:YeeE/YedE thiosulfate transporter family protein [Acidithiobacillus concretivorus]MBU2737426.1 YeeE/YedE family protein [Acidithiobacillus concretivorus]
MQHEWLMGFVGGLMIGTAALTFLVVNGRIMGVSGLIGGLIDRSGWGNGWERLVFLFGLFIVPALWVHFVAPVETHVTSNLTLIIIAGLLVGMGSRLANGCTSGHGVCGISRFSIRSIFATAVYLLSGIIAISIFRQLWGVI